ncbi:cell division protein DivIVA [Georgenia alba]|uniref:Cell division protein DivIVA n=1 Tax=Georgenia alba TaxID=2233858 RepID=A0ABW2Q806_9MICO
MTPMFPTAGRWRTGYDREQVEEFFARARASYEADDADGAAGPEGAPPPPAPPEGEDDEAQAAPAPTGPIDEHDVRGAAFDLVRDGYATAAVDAALDRLEAAFVQRRRAAFIAEQGESAWMDRVADLATTLYPRLLRPAGRRFRAPEKGRGYDRESVDQLMDRLIAYFDEGGEMTSAELRSTTFPSVPARRAYHEGTVDAYLARAVEVLVAVE